MKKPIIFFGTPDSAATVLESLIQAGYPIALVVTSPDKPIGRKQIITPSPVKEVALKHKLPLLQPEKLTTNHGERIQKSGGSLGVVVAYGYIIPQSIIDIVPEGLINIHYSLLPKYRGASPVESALLAGDAETGVSIQKLIFKLDAGPIIGSKKYIIQNEDTTPLLKQKLTTLGTELLLELLPSYQAGMLTPTPQNESEATHCGKIKKADGEIQLSDTDEEKWRKYRAYFGWPGIFYFDEHGKRVKITEASCEGGIFTIKKIIPEGKGEISLS